jgi:hypothetical protein
MARRPKNLRHYLDPQSTPGNLVDNNRWRPRRAIIESEPIEPAPLDKDGCKTRVPLSEEREPEGPEDDMLALPEPPPPQPGDDLQIPNPVRWAPEQTPLPSWLWAAAVLVAIAFGIAITSMNGGPRAELYPEPMFILDE